MHKTTIMIDDSKIERASRVLGTKGIRETVEAALDAAIKADARMRFFERMRTGKGFDRRSLLKARKEAWR